MEDLRVIGVESGALLLASDDGSRFRIPVDDVLQAGQRHSSSDPGATPKLAPREIQAHIRSGMSAQDVASITGVPLAHVQKFEGPVLAEREFVVESALNVPVHSALETDPLAQEATFGSVIRGRLHDLGAVGERWASWKDLSTGWIVKLSFTADQVDHDARWRFDPKKLALTPMNSEATTLSQQGEATGALLPRLRAVKADDRSVESSRFDSGAFEVNGGLAGDSGPVPEPIPYSRRVETAEEPPLGHQTADLLDALRRRRGEREAPSFEDDGELPMHPTSGGGIRLVPVSLDDLGEGLQSPPEPRALARPSRKGRVAMPSWDEIVFGARPDDDFA